MNLKSLLARPFANYIYNKTRKGMQTAIEDQEAILKMLLKHGRNTVFGKEHRLDLVSDQAGFAQAVPVRDYEQFKPYIEQIKEGKQNILWKGRPIYFAKTSGTTSGVKYIPITKDSIDNHINTARNALLCYMAETGNSAFASGKMIFLSGSPELERVGNIPTGRLSGIVNHHVPSYLRANQLPSYETNCIEDWETKLDKIVQETLHKDMTLISGIPPWMQMYFDRLTERSGKKVSELFPNFSVMVQGGVNFEPYKARMFETIGKKIDSIELFPASEGFFAFQDSQNAEGLLLNTNSGIYYEFIPVGEIFSENPTRLSLKEVKTGENYAMIINSNAGLWGYNLGDTVKFVSTEPYRLLVTGRIKHFISAFGEHVIGEEVEQALLKASNEEQAKITEFTVAPMIQQEQGKSYHEWFIEFEQEPADMQRFIRSLELSLRQKNVYYDDLISGNILMQLQVRKVQKNGFIDYMRSIGKLGGQNKVPRLSNDRVIADGLAPFLAR
ncbi:MAG: GH3 auxin-responsive promoter family protein [Chitinophagaceae bacterium]|nr:GH3 auxin-responsive promoter family protein [Chitinophagaceae bacterium]MCA6454005.1 GH3 auxin-responsive promoter family protein [Chitinophagaceae bacterium]MCA6456025.1 GH3 auxin-responsive promoter family protein [Chitinophagaceae bacterium]MCA6457660.1 GH3 auxin-responsive promoter family protein [Chitinophagaceae bacterium]MCA6463373.1 GH3 auxin-responsive promoter family protein [Chitinophagaceae bacterium]